MEYDKWQEEILAAEGNVLLNKGRQIGGTEIFAHKAAEFIVNNPNEQIICVSDTLDQAENIIIMVLAYLQENHPKKILRGKHKPTKTRVWVKGNGHIRSRPVGDTGDAVRSFTGKVLYVDEASKMPRSFWLAAKAIMFTRSNSAIWMSSTPRGKFDENRNPTYYYKSYLNVNNKFKVIEQDSEWVAYNRKICKTWTIEQRRDAIQHLKDEKEDMTEAEYAQEYLGRFMDDLQQWFEDDLITSCMTEERGKIKKDATYYLGIDVARMGEDESTFEIFELRGKHLYQVENQITTKTTLPQTFEHIKSLHALYEFSNIFIDSVGIGVGVFDWLMWDDDTKHVTEAIDNSKQIMSNDGKTRKLQKTLKYSHFKMMMETGRIHLLDEPKIFQSFKSVQYAYTNDSLGVRHLKIFGNYTHIAEGSTNAAWGEKYKHLNLNVYSIKV